MWRGDSARGAVSLEELAPELHLQWVRKFPGFRPAWPAEFRLQFDKCYEPIVVGRQLFVGSPLADWVVALDTTTGAEQWRFWTEGPVRFAPASVDGRVYVGSDDGWLYCLDATSGKLLWKHPGGPADRRLIGNERVMSVWPVRGGPVVADGIVYFATGLWPFMGVYVHALRADTGDVVWTNSTSHSIYAPVDHNFWDYVGISPQGYLVVAGNRLIVPSGRSWPAIFDRETGKLLHFAQGQALEYTKGTNWNRPSWQAGSWHVSASDRYIFNMLPYGNRSFGGILDLETGGILEMAGPAQFPPLVVLEGDTVYAGHPTIRTYGEAAKSAEAGEKPTLGLAEKWKCNVPANALIKAGSRLYAGAAGAVRAVELPSKDTEARVSWQASVEGTVQELLAADGKLFGVTKDGRIYCFGAEKVEPRRHMWEEHALAPADVDTVARGARILDATAAKQGYCIIIGAGDGALACELARQSELTVIVIERDARRLRDLREKLQGTGLYGPRIAAIHLGTAPVELSPYMASVIVVADLAQLAKSPIIPLEQVFSWLHPYGGVLCLPTGDAVAAELANWRNDGGGRARIDRTAEVTLVTRIGPPPGTADWTHEYCDAARSLCSRDQLAKPPFGVLWFGGPTDRTFVKPFFIPRYYPAPLICAGRMYAQDFKTLHATDIYTGRILWQAPLPDPNEVFEVYRLRTPGYTSVALPDAVYVACGPTCIRLDPETGARTKELKLPGKGRHGEEPFWGFLAAYEDLLVASAAIPNRFWDDAYASVKETDLSPVETAQLMQWVRALETVGERKMRESESRGAMRDRVLSELLETKTLPDHFSEELRQAIVKRLALRLNTNDRLVVLDRHTGEPLWERRAAWGFTHINNQLGNPRFEAIAVGNDRVFCLDTAPYELIKRMERRGHKPVHQPSLLALNVRNGAVLWQATREMAAKQWVAYSESHDVVLTGYWGGVCAFRGENGEELWRRNVRHNRAPIIHRDVLITMLLKGDLSGKTIDETYDSMYREWTMLDLETGEPKGTFRSPGAYCGFASGSEHFVTFRSTSAAYYDFAQDRVVNLSAFRTGCANNLIPAGGVISAPNYGYHCQCNYPIFTSLALFHMPELEQWVPVPRQDQRLSKRPPADGP